MKIVKLRITLVDGRFRYNAEAIDDCGRYYYRVGKRTIEISKNEYDRVIANPRLYYFSTALKLHKSVEKGLGKYVRLSESSVSHEMVADQDKTRWSRLLEQMQSPQPEGGADVEDCTLLEAAPEIDRLVTWGILNPLGPTVESLCLATDPSGKAKVIFVKTSNPFANSTVALGAIAAGLSDGDLFRAIMNSTTPAPGESSRILQFAPTFVIPPVKGELMQSICVLIVSRNINAVRTNVDLASEVDRLKRFWLDPWARVPSLQEMLEAARSQPPPARPQISTALFTEWWALVIDPEHIFSEWRAIVDAWQGAIEFQRDSPVAKNSVPAAEGLGFHRRLLDHPALFPPK
jgi:hypothetical protein